MKLELTDCLDFLNEGRPAVRMLSVRFSSRDSLFLRRLIMKSVVSSKNLA